jgi:hypothetical protein
MYEDGAEEGMGSEITVKGGEEVETLALYIWLCRVEVRGANFKPNEIHTVAQYVKQMIPSFTSFPSQPPQPTAEASASSSKQKSSRKGRGRSSERAHDDEPGKRKHRHKHKHRDRNYDLKEDERQEASSSSATFFSDYKGNRATSHGGGVDSIRVPKYNLVARTSHPNYLKCN